MGNGVSIREDSQYDPSDHLGHVGLPYLGVKLLFRANQLRTKTP
jgi:hypothetical protein